MSRPVPSLCALGIISWFYQDFGLDILLVGVFVFFRLDPEPPLLHLEGEEGQVFELRGWLDHLLGIAQARVPLGSVDGNGLGGLQDFIGCFSKVGILGLYHEGIEVSPPLADLLHTTPPADDAFLHFRILGLMVVRGALR